MYGRTDVVTDYLRPTLLGRLGEMETRHLVWDHLAVSFRHLQSLRSYDGLKSQGLEIFKQFSRVLEKDPLW